MHVTLFLKVLDREEPGARVWPNWCHNYTPKLPFFKISVYLPAFLYNFHTYNIIYFSHQMIKVIWDKFGLLRLHALSILVGGGGRRGGRGNFLKGQNFLRSPHSIQNFLTPPPPPPFTWFVKYLIFQWHLKKMASPFLPSEIFFHPPLFPSKIFKTLPKKIRIFYLKT